MAKKVEREHRRQAEARHTICRCVECTMERANAAKFNESGTVTGRFSASKPNLSGKIAAAQTYVDLHGTEVYTADGRCMVASCDGGHLDRDQAQAMAARIARLLTADETEQAHVRHARRTGKTLTKIAGAGPAGDDGFDAAWRASGRVYGDDALENVKLGWKMRGERLSARDLQPSEDYVLAVEELKRQIRRVEKILRNASSTKMIDELWRCAERLKSAMAAFSAVDPNADRTPRPAADGARS